MNKLASLRQAIIDSPLQIKESELDVYATKGNVRSANGDHNQDFELQYTAHILLRNYAENPDGLFYLVMRWLDKYQPNHVDNAIQFEADIIDHRSSDIYIAVPLTETVTTQQVAEGIELVHPDDPSIDPVYLSGNDWSMYIGNSGEASIESWVQGV